MNPADEPGAPVPDSTLLVMTGQRSTGTHSPCESFEPDQDVSPGPYVVAEAAAPAGTMATATAASSAALVSAFIY